MQKLKRWGSYFLSFIPTPLPRGMKDFEAWSDSVLDAYGLPQKDDYKHALAAGLMHLKQNTTRAPKRIFAKSIIRSQTNQTAYEAMQLIKEKRAKDEVVGGPSSEGSAKEMVQQAQANGLH